MAAIDKMHEFYTCLRRFAFLSECYAPESIENDEYVSKAFKSIQDYAKRLDTQKKIEEAEEWFDEMNKKLEMHRRKDLLGELVKECSK